MVSKNIDALVSHLSAELERHVRAEIDRGNHNEVANSATLAAALKVFSERKSFVLTSIEPDDNAGKPSFTIDDKYLTKSAKGSSPSSLRYKHRVPIQQVAYILGIVMNELKSRGCVSSKAIQAPVSYTHLTLPTILLV